MPVSVQRPVRTEPLRAVRRREVIELRRFEFDDDLCDPAHWLDPFLRGAERPVATVHGFGRRRNGAGTERVMVLTSRRVLVFKRGELVKDVPLVVVNGIRLKRALSNFFPSVVTVDLTGGRPVSFEGDWSEVDAVESALSQVPSYGHVEVTREASFGPLRLNWRQ